MSRILDVQGFSHVTAPFLTDYHAAWPNKPLVASEWHVKERKCNPLGVGDCLDFVSSSTRAEGPHGGATDRTCSCAQKSI